MGHRKLFAVACRAPACRWLVRRSLWTPACFSHRCHRVRHRFGLVRFCREHWSADRRARLCRDLALRCWSREAWPLSALRFPSEDRGPAIGTWSAFTAITAAVGPVLGGWLIEHISWRAIFFINLPLAFLVVMISLRYVPESRDENATGKLDWLGGIFAVISLGAIVYGLLESSRRGLTNPAILTALFGGLLFLVIFLLWEKRVRNPMLPLDLFRSRNFTGANLLTFFLYSALGGTLFFLPLNLIQVHGYNATAAGAALLPFILIIFVLSRWAGGLVQRYRSKASARDGPAIAATGFALLMIPGTGGNYWSTFFPAIVVLGLGMAISVAPLTTTVMNSVPENRVGIASGINNAVSRAGGLLAIAVLGLVMVFAYNRALDRRVSGANLSRSEQSVMDESRSKLAGATVTTQIEPGARARLTKMIDDSFVSAFRSVMLIGAALAFASSVSALLLIDGKPRVQRNIRAPRGRERSDNFVEARIIAQRIPPRIEPEIAIVERARDTRRSVQLLKSQIRLTAPSVNESEMHHEQRTVDRFFRHG